MPGFGAIRTIVGVDVRGFGKLLRRIGDDRAADLARTFQTTVRQAAASAGGWTFDAVADTALSAFHQARQGIEGAVQIREALRGESWPDDDFAVGIAVHTGRLVAEHQGGTVVWHCNQLVDTAEPWQILVSHATHALLEGEVLAGIELRDLGQRDFPRLEASHHVYELVTH